LVIVSGLKKVLKQCAEEAAMNESDGKLDNGKRHLRLVLIVAYLSAAACGMIGFGCAPHKPGQLTPSAETVPPPPTFTSIPIDTLGGHQSIHAKGFEDYVLRYGREGWLVGLSDGRTIDAMIPRGSQDIERSTASSNAAALGGLRVKDVFYYYYLRRPDVAQEYQWQPSGSMLERDKGIAEAIVWIASK
jgi:hypothetical protein